MNMYLVSSVTLVASLASVWFLSERIVESALLLARRYQLSSFVIGALLLSFVTGLPELIVSIMSIVNDTAQVSVGDIIGSNLIDTSFVIGLAVLITGAATLSGHIQKKTLFTMTLGVGSVMALIAFLNPLTPLKGILLLALYGGGTLWMIREGMMHQEEGFSIHDKGQGKARLLVTFLAAIAALLFVTDVAMRSVKVLVSVVPLPLEVWGVTIFALATSLPEMALAVHAGRHKAYNFLLGNALGAAFQQGTFTMGVLAVGAGKSLAMGSIVQGVWYTLAGFSIIAYCLYKEHISRASGSALVGVTIMFFVHQLYMLW